MMKVSILVGAMRSWKWRIPLFASLSVAACGNDSCAVIASAASNPAPVCIVSAAGTILPGTFATCTNLTASISVGTVTSTAPCSASSALDPPAPATKTIYAASYDGFLHILKLSGTLDTGYKLEAVGRNDGCKTNPTWLTLEPQKRHLWCLEEGNVAGLGTINTFSIGKNGSMQRFQRKSSVGIAPVQNVFFDDGKGLAVALYGGGVNFFRKMENGTILEGALKNFTLDKPKAAPQDKSRPHGFAVDPSGGYLVSPDLGADLVRTFRIERNQSAISVGPAASVTEGTGPRHATFWSPTWKVGDHWDGKADVFLYVLGELSSTITTFKVGYPQNGTLVLVKLGETKNFGGAVPSQSVAPKAAEIMVSVSSWPLSVE